MTQNKEAIIFIPGNDSIASGQKLNELVGDLQLCNSVGKVEVSDNTELYGHNGVELTVHYDNGESRKIDIYEAFWADLKSEFDLLRPLKKPFVGLYTLLYWSHPSLWKFSKGDTSKKITLILSLVTLIFWYLLVLTTFLAFIKTLEFNSGVDWLDSAFKVFKESTSNLPEFTLLAITMVASYLPVNQMANLSYNCMLYLKTDELRNAKRRRVHNIVHDVVHQSSCYDKITILSHSLGSAIGAHFVSEMKLDLTKYKFRFISLGAAISFLSHRSEWLKNAVHQCFYNESVDNWVDFFSDEDWVCSSVKLEDKQSELKALPKHFESRELKFGSTLIERLFNAGKIHGQYTKNSDVVNTILG